MSRSHSYTSKYPLDIELIERRQFRGKEYRAPNPVIHTEEKNIVISERTLKQIDSILGWSGKSLKFVKELKNDGDKLTDSIYTGTLDWNYGWLREEQNRHEIYSPDSEKTLAKVLEHNIALTPDYLNRGEYEAPLLLTYNPSPPRALKDDELTRIRTKAWGFLYWILPPEEFLNAAIYAREYLMDINRRIEQTKKFLNITLARPLDQENN